MYIRSKNTRAVDLSAIPSENFTKQKFVALCDNYPSSDKDKVERSDFFIESDFLDQVLEKLETLHRIYKCVLPPEVFIVEEDLLISSEHKYVIYIREPYYHYIINTLVSILFIYKNNPDAKFVIFYGCSYLGSYENEKNKDFLGSILKAHKVEHYFAKSTLENNIKYLVYKINNFTVIYDYSPKRGITLGDITDALDSYIIPLTKLNFISNTKSVVYVGRDSNVLHQTVGSRRLHDELLLEEYLESRGVYILKSSNMTSHWDQIAILQEASTLIGVTGTGLINSLMMRDNQTVIELKIEIIHGFDSQILIDYYADFAYAKGHTYIAVGVPDKQAATAIARLEKILD
jgi:hypothetical protein